MGISAGLYNTLLDLQRPTDSFDDTGGVIQTYASVGWVRARISSLSSNEKMINNKVYTDATHKIFMDAVDIRESDNLVWGDWTFQVLGIVNPSESYHHLEVFAKEIE